MPTTERIKSNRSIWTGQQNIVNGLEALHDLHFVCYWSCKSHMRSALHLVFININYKKMDLSKNKNACRCFFAIIHRNGQWFYSFLHHFQNEWDEENKTRTIDVVLKRRQRCAMIIIFLWWFYWNRLIYSRLQLVNTFHFKLLSCMQRCI